MKTRLVLGSENDNDNGHQNLRLEKVLPSTIEAKKFLHRKSEKLWHYVDDEDKFLKN